jgi:hypothetical protein
MDATLRERHDRTMPFLINTSLRPVITDHGIREPVSTAFLVLTVSLFFISERAHISCDGFDEPARG